MTLPLPLLARFARLFLLSLALQNAVSRAEEPSAPAATPVARPFDLDFKGGTLADFVAAAKAGGRNFNLVAHSEHLGVAVPPFSVRNVQPHVLAEALNRLVNIYGLTVSAIDYKNGTEPLFTVGPGARPPRANAFQAYQLAPFLTVQPVEEIVSALRTAWELVPGRDPAALAIKYHPGTKLLLVSGPPEAVEMSTLLIGRLFTGEDQNDQKQMEAVSAEVRRRRELREAANAEARSGNK